VARRRPVPQSSAGRSRACHPVYLRRASFTPTIAL